MPQAADRVPLLMLAVDRDSSAPMHRQVFDQIRARSWMAALPPDTGCPRPARWRTSWKCPETPCSRLMINSLPRDTPKARPGPGPASPTCCRKMFWRRAPRLYRVQTCRRRAGCRGRVHVWPPCRHQPVACPADPVRFGRDCPRSTGFLGTIGRGSSPSSGAVHPGTWYRMERSAATCRCGLRLRNICAPCVVLNV